MSIKMNPEILRAKKLLNEGNVIAIPTETVYGLAANAFDEQAVIKIFDIKGRPRYNPLIVHIKSIDYLETIAQNIPEIAYKLANKFWPGPLTLVLEKKDIIPYCVTSNKNTVGIRVPNHTLTLELLHQLDYPLAAPSANPFGYISPTKSSHVAEQLGAKIPYILEGGDCEKGVESTILGFNNEEVILYRVGAISKEIIENFVGIISEKTTSKSTPEAPGMLAKHYSPKTKFVVSDNIEAEIKNFPNKKIGLLLFESKTYMNKYVYELVSKNGNLDEAAHHLYAKMHLLDNQNLYRIEMLISPKMVKNIVISAN
jgi:L-threonylcarbamoyladenylate synthase